MLANLRRVADEIALTEAPIEEAAEQLRPLLNFVAMIGTRLGEMHVVLAAPTEDEAFRPSRAQADDVEVLRRAVTGEVNYAFSKLEELGDDVDADILALARPLFARREEIVRFAERLTAKADGTLLTRAHGDFHLGQILVSEGDAVLIDFEGEPARNLAERRAKTSPMRDVAGLLRSLNYLAATAELDADAVTEHNGGRRLAVIREFSKRAETVFLEEYRQATKTCPDLASDEADIRNLLGIFLLEKAAYEIAYEARNRPKWLPIPLAGMSAIIEQLLDEGQ